MKKQLEFKFMGDMKNENRKEMIANFGRKILMTYYVTGVVAVYGIITDCLFNNGKICETIQNYLFR